MTHLRLDNEKASGPEQMLLQKYLEATLCIVGNFFAKAIPTLVNLILLEYWGVQD
jgi:hypothetical protein